MPQVQILARDTAVQFPQPFQAVEVAAITYLTAALGPRVLNLPLSRYRSATAEELVNAPRYRLLPIDNQALAQERQDIQQDIQRAQAAPPEVFDVP